MVQICMISLFLLATQLHWSFTHGYSDTVRKAYIVYMGEAPQSKASATDLHHNLLSLVVKDDHIAQQSRIYSYTKSFNAFAANLLPQEVQRLQENENVVSVFPSKMQKLHTTRSWDFLGMPQSMKRNHQIESNIIVGVLDTGIYINAPSFDDKGFGPPPSKWKGTCQVRGNFTGCNNKVIGARFYNHGSATPHPNPSPIDEEGHGSHTSSTIAGASIAGASLYGLAKGTARGGVPSARIAMYKVCWADGCSDIDLLAGLDDAIDDGVDLISISIGGDSTSYFNNPIAIGAFHAMKRGILTTCSAGNNGPYLYSVQNTAPWILTVGASGMDRQFRTLVKVGNGLKTAGFSINTFSPNKRMYPLTTAVKAANRSLEQDHSPWLCDDGSLDANKVKGKIVLCKEGLIQDYVKQIGGLGALVSLQQQKDTGFTFTIPAAFIDANVGDKIEIYVNSTRAPQAVIYKSIAVHNAATPFVASFSSRGPNTISSSIIKPDIVAPGIDILAAYSKLSSVTGDLEDNRFDVYNIISGTSMACPHVAAAAAYVKSFHPNWSPAAIKSALMTTASELKIKDVQAELAYGAGQIDPVRALHPGLIYDVSKSDYIHFLCNEGYSGTALKVFTEEKTNCSSIPDIGGHDALNYPSMYLQLNSANSSISAIFHRTVTNVGLEKGIYKAIVKAPATLKVTVVPKELAFSHLYEKKSFMVVIKGPPLNNISSLSASLEWNDGKHRVKSPIHIFLDI
ncbi:subtilisin-like protease SBT4.15 [Quercus robur]|uniref:subtilisin-like protease SBT4.15 n=1 Tax=Quercus robur TaxID=38942 RepID=UPI0021635C0F|nr:subtilisin-like protease SBT4.15 [Quercus robur]